MYVELAYLSSNLQHYTDWCVGVGFNGRNILFLLYRCALFHCFSFLIRWVSLNRIPVTRYLALRVTPIFTSKIHAIISLKMAPLSRSDVMLS
jgi:hypothetical protein